MNKIEQLIQQLCPEGVEFKRTQDVCKRIISGGTPSTSRTEYYGGEIPWLRTQEVDWLDISDTSIKITEDGLKNSSANWIPANCVIVAMYGATAAKVAINKVPLTTNQACCNLEIDEKKANYKYVFYWFCNEYRNLKALGEGSQSNINGQKVKNYEIPVPPLPIQQEIVTILDKFTRLEAELKAELEAELEARQKQYEYYRNELLNFEGKEVEWKTLGEVCSLKAGKSISAYDISNIKNEENSYQCLGGNGLRGYVKSFSHFGEYPIIGRQGALCGNINYGVGKFYATEHAVVVSHKGKFISRFLYYLLFSMNLNQYATGGAQPGLAVSKLEKIKIPIPPLSEQNRIVEILDKFDALVASTSSATEGLPAEIAARRKQYEYYRGKLLDFKNMSNG
jgi:type I restriction enzyme S subunit